MKQIIFSTVLFDTPIKDLKRLIDSVSNLQNYVSKNNSIKINIRLIIWDNSFKNNFYKEKIEFDKQNIDISFFSSIKNIGYGLGHNSNLLKIKPNKDIWFVALNPDIYFEGKSLFGFFNYLFGNDENLACAAPLIFLANGNIQYSAKKNPTTLSLLVGRFSFFRKFPFLERYLYSNQNRDKNYEREIIKCQNLSGCFLVFPSEIFIKIRGFSKRYFLHFEDADIVRRAALYGETIHCPFGFANHIRGRGSHKSIIQQYHLIISYFVYSKFWGYRFM